MPVSPLDRAPTSDREQPADPMATGEFSLITRRIAVRTGAETGVLVVWNESDEIAHVLASWGAARGGLGPGVSRRGNGGFVGRVLDSALSYAEAVDDRVDPSLGHPASGARLTYAAGAGIRPPGGPAGALCLGFTCRPPDIPLTLWRIESYGRLAALCLDERGTLDGLLATARLDGLTGCLNYAASRAELDREIRRAERHGRPMSCCFIDLDRFKGVNDRHGHLYGNRVLAQVAAVLRHGVRVGDTVGRYGGDEFLAILPDADENAARALGERLRSKISTTTPRGSDERLDASIGIAQWRPGATADELLGAADVALLRAKDHGGGIVAGAGGDAVGAGRDASWGPGNG